MKHATVQACTPPQTASIEATGTVNISVQSMRAIFVDGNGLTRGIQSQTFPSTAPVPRPALVQWFFDWQGLEAGFLALFAAVIGAIYLRQQTKQAARFENRKNARALLARKAVLPLTLSGLSGWADDWIDGLLAVVVTSTRAISPKDLPVDAVPALERFIEACDDAAATSVADLIADIQIFDARMRAAGFGSGKALGVTDPESHLMGIGAIAARIASLFDYSRRRSDSAPERVTWEDVRKALKLAGAEPAIHTRLFERIAGREKGNIPPGYLAAQEDRPLT